MTARIRTNHRDGVATNICLVVAALAAALGFHYSATPAASRPTAIETVCSVQPAWGGFDGYVVYGPGVTYFSHEQLQVGTTYDLALSWSYDPKAVYPIRDITGAAPASQQSAACPPPLVSINAHS